MGCDENIVGHDQKHRHSERERMVTQQMIARGVKDSVVLAVMRHVPRHRFVLDVDTSEAYGDYPLSIGHKQTISQPFIVAFMTEALQLKPEDRVLEIGTGSGYQAAVLAHIVSKVLSVEIVEPLAKRAEHILKDLGCDNVRVKVGDGYQGWPGEAPFQAIILTAAPDHIPQPLLEQLDIGGRLILPIGGDPQSLMLVHRRKQGYTQTKLLAVTFVPMTGQAREGC